MNTDLAVSVIVPTVGRRESLWRLLSALARQRRIDAFEVVIVVDGASVDAVGSAPCADWPFPLSVESQRALGPGAARNRGVALSRGRLLVFLDDDLEPGAETLFAHVELHARHRRAIGAGDLEPATAQVGFVGTALAGWWDVVCDGLRDPRHRFTFRDLLSGHCSMRRETFRELDGFDPAFHCHEDFELGYRALERGIELRFVEGADARHHDASTLPKILARKFDEGIADVQLVRKHPRLLEVLPLGRPLADSRFERLAFRAVMDGSVKGRLVGVACRHSMSIFHALSMRDKWRTALEAAMTASYWRGVVRATGSVEVVRDLRSRDIPPSAPPFDVDIGAGLEPAERQIEQSRPAALRVFVRGEFVCRLDEVVGAEPLRGVHLRPLLLKGYAREFAAACARVGMLPDVFLGCIQHAPVPTATAPSANAA